MRRNARGGSVIRGGSTISQQTAKNAFLWQGGGYFRKGLEAWFTLLIENLWDKRRIMEVYLNVAETGIGTYGVNAGAQRYFGHDASNPQRQRGGADRRHLPASQAPRGDRPDRLHPPLRQHDRRAHGRRAPRPPRRLRLCRRGRPACRRPARAAAAQRPRPPSRRPGAAAAAAARRGV